VGSVNFNIEQIGLSRTQEDDMATFILTINWIDQGIRNVRDASKGGDAAKELAKESRIRDHASLYPTSTARGPRPIFQPPGTRESRRSAES
jgi:hypothetical protein